MYPPSVRPPATFSIGSTIGGSYTVEGELGRGGMGIVLLASHVRLPGKKVAIKVLHASMAATRCSHGSSARRRSPRCWSHPNIVHVEDYNVTPDGTPYLVLEYLEGESLAQRIARGPLALEQVLSIVRQVGSALAAAHAQGIVHRDLKPQNIFLVPTELDGPHDRGRQGARLRHLEDARRRRRSRRRRARCSARRNTWRPNRRPASTSDVDERTDVFALGAIVYEMLSGKPAFSGGSIPEVVFKVVYEQPAKLPADVPPALAAAVTQAMAKAPAERFSSVNGFIEALTGRRVSTPAAADIQSTAALAQTMASTDRTESPLAPTLPTAATTHSRKRLIISASVVAVVIVAAVVAVFAVRRSTHPHERLGPARMKMISAQLFDGDAVEIGRHRYPVRQTKQHLKLVKFELGGEAYEAIEQNPEKQSEWAELARAGHRVVHFRDLATNRYVGVTVDGEARSEISELPLGNGSEE